MTTVLLTLLACLLLSVSCGLAADCFVNILTQPGQVLAFWAKLLYHLRDEYADSQVMWYVPHRPSDDTRSLADVRREAEARADYVLKPILTCVNCVGGQLGFWLSLYFFLQYFTFFRSIPYAILTAVLSVWMGGLFQFIQKKYFPL